MESGSMKIQQNGVLSPNAHQEVNTTGGAVIDTEVVSCGEMGRLAYGMEVCTYENMREGPDEDEDILTASSLEHLQEIEEDLEPESHKESDPGTPTKLNNANNSEDNIWIKSSTISLKNTVSELNDTEGSSTMDETSQTDDTFHVDMTSTQSEEQDSQDYPSSDGATVSGSEADEPRRSGIENGEQRGEEERLTVSAVGVDADEKRREREKGRRRKGGFSQRGLSREIQTRSKSGRYGRNGKRFCHQFSGGNRLKGANKTAHRRPVLGRVRALQCGEGESSDSSETTAEEEYCIRNTRKRSGKHPLSLPSLTLPPPPKKQKFPPNEPPRNILGAILTDIPEIDIRPQKLPRGDRDGTLVLPSSSSAVSNQPSKEGEEGGDNGTSDYNLEGEKQVPKKQKQGKNKNSQQGKHESTTGTHHRILMSWERDYPLGLGATRAPVLYALDKIPDKLKAVKGGWINKARVIWATWRRTSGAKRDEYCERAKQNRLKEREKAQKRVRVRRNKQSSSSSGNANRNETRPTSTTGVVPTTHPLQQTKMPTTKLNKEKKRSSSTGQIQPPPKPVPAASRQRLPPGVDGQRVRERRVKKNGHTGNQQRVDASNHRSQAARSDTKEGSVKTSPMPAALPLTFCPLPSPSLPSPLGMYFYGPPVLSSPVHHPSSPTMSGTPTGMPLASPVSPFIHWFVPTLDQTLVSPSATANHTPLMTNSPHDLSTPNKSTSPPTGRKRDRKTQLRRRASISVIPYSTTNSEENWEVDQGEDHTPSRTRSMSATDKSNMSPETAATNSISINWSSNLKTSPSKSELSDVSSPTTSPYRSLLLKTSTSYLSLSSLSTSSTPTTVTSATSHGSSDACTSVSHSSPSYLRHPSLHTPTTPFSLPLNTLPITNPTGGLSSTWQPFSIAPSSLPSSTITLNPSQSLSSTSPALLSFPVSSLATLTATTTQPHTPSLPPFSDSTGSKEAGRNSSFTPQYEYFDAKLSSGAASKATYVIATGISKNSTYAVSSSAALNESSLLTSRPASTSSTGKEVFSIDRHTEKLAELRRILTTSATEQVTVDAPRMMSVLTQGAEEGITIYRQKNVGLPPNFPHKAATRKCGRDQQKHRGNTHTREAFSLSKTAVSPSSTTEKRTSELQTRPATSLNTAYTRLWSTFDDADRTAGENKSSLKKNTSKNKEGCKSSSRKKLSQLRFPVSLSVEKEEILGPGSVIPLGLDALIPQLPTNLSSLASSKSSELTAEDKTGLPEKSKPSLTTAKVNSTQPVLSLLSSQTPSQSSSDVMAVAQVRPSVPHLETSKSGRSMGHVSASLSVSKSTKSPSVKRSLPAKLSPNKRLKGKDRGGRKEQSPSEKEKQASRVPSSTLTGQNQPHKGRSSTLPHPLTILPLSPTTPHSAIPQTVVPQTTLPCTPIPDTPTPTPPFGKPDHPVNFLPGGQPRPPFEQPPTIYGQISPLLPSHMSAFSKNLACWELERLYYHNVALLEQQRRYTKYLENELRKLELSCRETDPGNRVTSEQLQNYRQFLSYVVEPEIETDAPFPFPESHTTLELEGTFDNPIPPPQLDYYGDFLKQCNTRKTKPTLLTVT